MMTSRPLTVVTAVLLVACPSLISGLASSRCPLPNLGSRYIQEHGEKCYQFVFNEKTWMDARKYCHDRGAALANANTNQKQQFLQGVLTNPSKLGNYFGYNGFWIGLHDRDTENTFEWDRGPGKTEVNLGPFTNWAANEPNNILGNQDCVYMRKQYSWKWVDVSCSGGIGRTYSFACEYDLKPRTTTSTTKKPTTPTTTAPTTRKTTTTTTTTTTPKPTTTSTTPKPSTTRPKTVNIDRTSFTTVISADTSTTTLTTKSASPTTSISTKSSQATQYFTTSFNASAISDDVTNETSTNSPSTKGSSDGLPSIDDDDIFIPPNDEADEPDKYPVAGFSNARSNANDTDTAKTVALPISLVVLVAVLVVVIVILILRRRRRKHTELALTLSNPCYGTDNNTGYPSCRIPDNGNVYVDVDGNPPEQCAADTNENGVNSGKWISPPSSPIQQFALPIPDEPEQKFLDEYGLYTSDGYMAPKHLYAEVPDIVPPPRKPPTAHYSIPENNQPCDLDANVYEDIRGSQLKPNLDSLPVDDIVYEVPLSARVSNSKPVSESVAAAAAEYDVPKSILPVQSK